MISSAERARGAFDDAVTTGVQRKRTAMEILTDLLRAEGAHRHAASIRYADMLDQSCFLWNCLIDQPWRIMSIGLRSWAHG